jgi:hypothetical protein
LVKFIQNLINKTVLYSKLSPQAQPWWILSISEAITQERRARRYWNRTKTEESWDIFLRATEEKCWYIASTKQAYWRTEVYKAAVSKEGIWKLAK